MSLQITGIRKPDPDSPHEAISHYRWRKDGDGSVGIDTRDSVINYLEQQNEKAYVADGSNKIWCGIRNNGHIKYLQTYADDKWSNNLLALPQV